MRNTRLIVIALLGSGIVLLLLIGFFIISFMKGRAPQDNPLDTQPDTIDRTIDGTNRFPTSVPDETSDESPGADFEPELSEEQRRNNPDMFIYNRIPFENQYFRIEGVLRQESNPDFSFIVTLKGEDKEFSRTKLTQWLTELGLTAEQISALLIEYR